MEKNVRAWYAPRFTRIAGSLRGDSARHPNAEALLPSGGKDFDMPRRYKTVKDAVWQKTAYWITFLVGGRSAEMALITQ